jgi:exodeoxyribonuclease-5
MDADYLVDLVLERFPHSPTDEQREALQNIAFFLLDTRPETLFLLKGYAGVGKSSLLGALVATTDELQQKTILLAPTGRAAKVLAHYARHEAFTIHKKIYRQNRFGEENQRFSLSENRHKDTVFIVDEASMIGNRPSEHNIFGSGRLLEDLILYVYSGDNCRLILIGDTAQLPPVGEELSPAIQRDNLQLYNLKVREYTLTKILRQASQSGILYNATAIRNAIAANTTTLFPKFVLKPFADICAIDGSQLIDCIEECYSKSGIEQTMVLVRSNKHALVYNQGIRNRILWREEEISAQDVLIVTKNNYFWSLKTEENSSASDFIANGEMLEVLRVKRQQEFYGFRFCDILARHPDYDIEIELKVLLDTLQSEQNDLSQERQQALYDNIIADYNDLPAKSAKLSRLKQDPFYNALHVKYGYAVTCHKAQGGEWENIFLDIGYVAEQQLGLNFYRWLYTAVTRATKRLFLVNIPKDFL